MLSNKNGYSRKAIEIKHANMCSLVVQLYIYESNFSSQMMTAIFFVMVTSGAPSFLFSSIVMCRGKEDAQLLFKAEEPHV